MVFGIRESLFYDYFDPFYPGEFAVERIIVVSLNRESSLYLTMPQPSSSITIARLRVPHYRIMSENNTFAHPLAARYNITLTFVWHTV